MRTSESRVESEQSETDWRGEVTLLLGGVLVGAVVTQVLPLIFVAAAVGLLFGALVSADIWDRDRLDDIQARVSASMASIVK